MLDAAIGEGANTFITIFIVTVAIIGGIVNIDVFKSTKKEGEDSK